MDNKAQWSLVAAAWVLAIGVIGLGLYAIRHFSREAALPGAVQSFGTPAKPLCPVDHVELALGPETPKVSFNGTIYYFCDNKDPLGRSHKTLFLMDPLLYLTGVSGYASPEPAPGPEAAALSGTAGGPAPSTPTATPTPAPKKAVMPASTHP